MAYNFPNSPSNGDTVTINGVVYTYNSTKGAWKTTASSGGVGGGGASVTVSETAPTSPSEGDLWFDPSVLKTFVYYNDGTANQWVQSNPTGSGGGASGGASVTVSETAPTSPSAGDLWWSSSEAVMYIYYTDTDSSQWVSTNTPGADGVDGADGSAQSYTNLAAFPSTGNTLGELAVAQDTKALYMWDGAEWDRVALGNDESPVILTEPPSSHQLSSTGANTTLTMLATDPEGFDITYGIAYKTAGSTRPAQLSADTTINQTTGVYTFTPTTNTSNAGDFRARLSASDGVKTTTRLVDFSLGFYIEILLAGGGGGGNDNAGGGGGAGGLVIDENYVYSAATTYNITVGAGGTAEQAQGDRGNPGGDSTFALTDGTIIYSALGGGGGGPYPGPDGNGDGGSGGGAGRATSGQEGASLQASYGGKGFGNAGGSCYNNEGGGGGGGAGGVGGNATSTNPKFGGDGGAGKASSITGSSVYYCPGGPGGGYNSSLGSYVDGTASSYGAGGAGGIYNTAPPAYDGASGVCIIATTSIPSALTGTYTTDTTSRPGVNIYTFTGNGSITF